MNIYKSNPLIDTNAYTVLNPTKVFHCYLGQANY